ncbi:MAG: Do family serine endopeptidase [Candidatus Kaelpia imicola]|nr:Do family serine endopeptidase [Candidatus Kaelpia imicola]
MKLFKFLGFLTLFVAGLFLGAALIVRTDLGSPVRAESGDREAAILFEDQPNLEVLSLESAFIRVAEEVGPAVVSIQSERTGSISGERLHSPFGGDDLFSYFFKDFFGEMPKREFRSIGLGSGIVINSEGYILTNQHVVDNADSITVTLSDGREFNAKLVGQDYRSDLAVLKIEAEDLPYVKLAGRGTVRIGQWAIAIGNPFGFAVNSPEPTVTVGVVSALHRHLPATEHRDRIYTDLIQTDAAINPGNSGGPLLNLKGEVIGINVAIYTTTGGYQGVGFAIPVEQARYVLDRLIKGEEIEYGWLGIQIQDLTQELADYLGLPDKKGTLIAKVIEPGPAYSGGLKEGDVVRELDGEVVEGKNDLLNKVVHKDVGSRIKIKIIRDKKPIAITITLGKRPDNFSISSGEVEKYNFRGIGVSVLSDELRSRYGITERGGVVVMKVEPGSIAAKKGVKPGDVILEINKKVIDSVKSFKEATLELKGQALIRTQRGYLLLNPEG